MFRISSLPSDERQVECVNVAPKMGMTEGSLLQASAVHSVCSSGSSQLLSVQNGYTHLIFQKESQVVLGHLSVT